LGFTVAIYQGVPVATPALTDPSSFPIGGRRLW